MVTMPGKCKRLDSHNAQARSGDITGYYSMKNEKRVERVAKRYSFILPLRECAYTYTPPYSFMACTGKT